MKFGVGQAVSRLEDPRLITGQGRFTADIQMPGQLYGAVLRAPLAHGAITRLDVAAARGSTGVRAVYCATDLVGMGDMPCIAQVPDVQGGTNFVPARPILARDRVHYVGQPVAFVVADSVQQARDALDLIELDIRELPCVVDLAAAAEASAPVLHEAHGSNVCVHYQQGDARAVDAALAESRHVVSLRLLNNRVAPAPLEPRACVASFDPARERWCGVVHAAQSKSGCLCPAVTACYPHSQHSARTDSRGVE